MDTKISSDFWAKPEMEAVGPDIRYAALWLLTNDRLSLCGHAIVSARRFAFETGLAEDVLAKAIAALPDTFTAVPGGYWARGYIRRQFGHGPALVASHMSKAVANAMRDAPPEVVELVRGEYPELSDRFEFPSGPSPVGNAPQNDKPSGTPSEALAKPLLIPSREAPSPTQGQRVRVGVGERAGAGAGEQRPCARDPARAPDLQFEALAIATGNDVAQLTPAARGALNAALKQIRTATPAVTPEEIRARAERYRAQHPTWALTAPSLAKHWPTLDGRAGQRRETAKQSIPPEPVRWREQVVSAMPNCAYGRGGRRETTKWPDLTPGERESIMEFLAHPERYEKAS